MAKKRFNVDILSKSSIEQLQKDLKTYKLDLTIKCREFVERLANEGIQTARRSVSNTEYGKFISFTKTFVSSPYGCQAIMLATNTGIIVSEWKTKDGVKTADVSPLLMAEFGSGPQAQNPKNVIGVGRGTFPEQTHAFESGWYYMDLQDQWHYSTGVTPSMPMFNAIVEMESQIVLIAKEVFK